MELTKKKLTELAMLLDAIRIIANTYTFDNEMNGKNYKTIAYSVGLYGVTARLVWVKDEGKFYWFKE